MNQTHFASDRDAVLVVTALEYLEANTTARATAGTPQALRGIITLLRQSAIVDVTDTLDATLRSVRTRGEDIADLVNAARYAICDEYLLSNMTVPELHAAIHRVSAVADYAIASVYATPRLAA